MQQVLYCSGARRLTPRLRPLASAACALLVMIGAPAWAQLTTSTQEGTRGSKSVSWLNFAGASLNPLPSRLTLAVPVNNGGITKTLHGALTLLGSAAANVSASAIPTSTGAALGQSGAYAAGGSPALRLGAGATTLTSSFTNLRVLSAAGNKLRYSFIAADAETTNDNESIVGTASTPWVQFDYLPALQNAGTHATDSSAISITGKTFLLTDNTTAYDQSGAYLVAAPDQPATVLVAITKPSITVQAMAFGLVVLDPVVSVSCSPASVPDAASGNVSTCQVSVANPPLLDSENPTFDVSLTATGDASRFSSTCGTVSFAVADVGADPAVKTCTVTATPNTTVGDGNVDVAVAVVNSPGGYRVDPNSGSAVVTVVDDDVAPPVGVPTLGHLALAMLGMLMGLAGWRSSARRG